MVVSNYGLGHSQMRKIRGVFTRDSRLDGRKQCLCFVNWRIFLREDVSIIFWLYELEDTDLLQGFWHKLDFMICHILSLQGKWFVTSGKLSCFMNWKKWIYSFSMIFDRYSSFELVRGKIHCLWETDVLWIAKMWIFMCSFDVLTDRFCDTFIMSIEMLSCWNINTKMIL